MLCTESSACDLVISTHRALKAHGWDVVGAEEPLHGQEAADIVDCSADPEPSRSCRPVAIAVPGSVSRSLPQSDLDPGEPAVFGVVIDLKVGSGLYSAEVGMPDPSLAVNLPASSLLPSLRSPPLGTGLPLVASWMRRCSFDVALSFEASYQPAQSSS